MLLCNDYENCTSNVARNFLTFGQLEIAALRVCTVRSLRGDNRTPDCYANIHFYGFIFFTDAEILSRLTALALGYVIFIFCYLLLADPLESGSATSR